MKENREKYVCQEFCQCKINDRLPTRNLKSWNGKVVMIAKKQRQQNSCKSNSTENQEKGNYQFY